MKIAYIDKRFSKASLAIIDCANDLIDNIYCGESQPKKWDIQFGHNPWLSFGIHLDHHDPSITFHLPGFLIYVGNCEQPGLRFWNEMAPAAIQEYTSDNP